MAGPTLDPAPLQTPIAGPGGKVTRWWADWLLLTLVQRVQSQAPSFADAQISLASQDDAIATTALLASANAGLYRVSWWTRVVVAAGVASSLTVNIHATDGGIAVTQSGAALTGNATDACEGQSVTVRCDGASALSYSTTYASNPANAMNYDLEIVVEAIGA